MPSFFDRLGKVAQQTAAAAQQAASEGRISLEIRNIQGRFDEKAKDLGVLMYRRNQGEEISDEAMLAVLQEMQGIDAEKKAKEAELEEIRKPAAPEASEAAPAPRPAAPVAPTPEPAPQPASTSEPTPVAEPAPTAPAGAACSCGAVNAPGAKFCTNCGQLLK
jgi:hypothetical protein